ncbi:unnamed protein product [Orchesella dallaii]|uniref:Uncharacterized protein n=1 Tax=Orchesella dallaii TaxID=48710 RepID=A0ABP1QXJ1_9HEXA
MPLNKKLLRAILVRKIRKKLKRKPREMSIRSLFFNRIEQGESILVRELREDPHYHHRYFRMRRETFDELLNKVQATLVKRRTHSRPISPMEKLAITLRQLHNTHLISKI